MANSAATTVKDILSASSKPKEMEKDNSQSEKRALYHASYDLLHSKKFSDVTIKCKRRTWRCHKNIICPRCPFFAAACAGDFAEAEAGVVVLHDDDPAAIEHMLTYIYTFELPDVINTWNLLKLFIAADKYSLSTLKNMTVTRLIDAIRTSVRLFASKDDEKKRNWVAFLCEICEYEIDDIDLIREVLLHELAKVANLVCALPELQGFCKKHPKYAVNFMKAVSEVN